VSAEKDLERMAKVLANLVDGSDINIDPFIGIAAILLKLQAEYVEIALLSTDGRYDQEQWTHRDVLDFLTKGA
jgi:hypothetical protein